MRLSEVPPGTSARVLHVVDGPHGRRMQDVGFLPGTVVAVMRRAPLGDPTLYELRGARLAVRRVDAALVEVGDTRD